MKLSSILYLLIAFSILGCAQKEEKSPKQKADSTKKKATEGKMETVDNKTATSFAYPEDLETAKYPSISDSLAKVWYEATERGEVIDISEYTDKGFPIPYYVKIIVPIYIKAKVLKKGTAHYEDEEWKYDYPIYNATVTEIIKGSYMHIGDQFTFDATTLLDPNPADFVVGEEYFMPLFRYADSTNSTYNYSLYIFTEYNNDAQYLIKNNDLYDKDNFWGLGTEVPWEKFKQSFMDDVKRIKSYK